MSWYFDLINWFLRQGHSFWPTSFHSWKKCYPNRNITGLFLTGQYKNLSSYIMDFYFLRNSGLHFSWLNDWLPSSDNDYQPLWVPNSDHWPQDRIINQWLSKHLNLSKHNKSSLGRIKSFLLQRSNCGITRTMRDISDSFFCVFSSSFVQFSDLTWISVGCTLDWRL